MRLRTCRGARSDCDFLVSVKERVLVLGASTHLFVELDFAVKVLLGDPGKVLGLLGVVCLHLGYRRVQHSFAPRRDFLVWLAGRCTSGQCTEEA